MTREERIAFNADVTLRDTELWQAVLEGTEAIIPAKACEPGFLYWGTSRRIGELAICHDVTAYGPYGNSRIFVGLYNEHGKDVLVHEYHDDEVLTRGIWRPLVRLEKVPDFADDQAAMMWLVEQDIVIKEERLEWLHAMPARLRKAPSYEGLLEDTKVFLDALYKKKEQGLSLFYDPTHLDTARRILGQRSGNVEKVSNVTGMAEAG